MQATTADEPPGDAPLAPTVLVVDDDEAIRDVLRCALEEEGYQVLTAVDGEVLPLARDRRPDLILLDVDLPVMDGVEVGRRLRADPATALIPIIGMSTDDQLDESTLALPMDGHLPKPFHLPELYDLAARWTHRDVSGWQERGAGRGSRCAWADGLTRACQQPVRPCTPAAPRGRPKSGRLAQGSSDRGAADGARRQAVGACGSGG
jgi:CheY-like chemotaxis protein